MKQETKNKFAEILAAAQAKAAQQATPKFSQPQPIAEPVKKQEETPTPEEITPAIQPQQPQEQEQQPDNMPELSTMTVESLLSNNSQELCAPSYFDIIKPYPLAVVETKPAFQVVDYNERSFAIPTPEKPTEDILAIFRQHGSYNQYLKCGKGWIFSKRHLQTVKTKLGI